MTIHPTSVAMSQKMTKESHKSKTEVKQSGETKKTSKN